MSLDSMLLIAITVLVAFMTIGVWGILFALVKSQNRSNAERAAARAASEPQPAASIDRILSETKRDEKSFVKPMDAPSDAPLDAPLDARRWQTAEAAVHEERPRIGTVPVAPSPWEKAERTVEYKAEDLSPDLSRETVVVDGKGKEEPAEPPDIDLRTGIITVAQEEPQQAKAARQKPAPKTKPAAPLVTKTPVKPPMKKSKPMPVPGEDAFDFEKEITAHGGRAMLADYNHESLDTKAIHTDKTMRWDKEELKRVAGGPESIVVDGVEPPQRPEKQDVIVPAPEAKREDAMISGEDIESTLDSFFGLGDK